MAKQKSAKCPPTRYICVGPNCWGKADTPEQAVKNCRKAGSLTAAELRKHYLLYETSEHATVDEIDGRILVETGGYARVIEKRGQ